MTFNALISIPGKIMLTGEYTALWGEPTLSAAVDRWMSLRCTGWPEQGLQIASTLWDQPRFTPFRRPGKADGQTLEECLLAAAGQALSGRFPATGLQVEVTSDIDPRLGLGSSSAYCLGLAMALAQHVRCSSLSAPITATPSVRLAADWAFRAQKNFQSSASGYDIITQMTGGLVEFIADPEPLDRVWDPKVWSLDPGQGIPPWLHFISNGRGAVTKDLVAATRRHFSERPALKAEFTAVMALLRSTFRRSWARPSDAEAWQPLIHAFTDFRRLFAETPAYPAETAASLEAIAGCGTTWNFKTTGAGGEDIFVVAAPPPDWNSLKLHLEGKGFAEVPLALTVQGAHEGST